MLAVEDDPLNRALLAEIVALRPQWDLETAPTLAEARARLSVPPELDLVLLDLHLPDGSGLDLLASAPHPRRVHLLTGERSLPAEGGTLAGGVLVKPYAVPDVLALLDRAAMTP